MHQNVPLSTARWGEAGLCMDGILDQQIELPVSQRGAHIKILMLLEDPKIYSELWDYVHLNKWVIDPVKLADFSAQQMLLTVAKTYGTDPMDKEL